jgi:hypothetical protein
MSPERRPYQSRNRRRPCNRCRERKVRCEGRQQPCQPCQRDGATCVFPDNDKTMRAVQTVSSPTPTHHERLTPGPANVDTPTFLNSFPGPAATSSWPAPPAQMTDIFSAPAPSTQISQSLDNSEDIYYQLAGASSDADPWLLRHCRFDDFGSLRLFKVHIRNAGGVPTRDKIPAHFLVGERDVYEAARLEAGVVYDGDLREELVRLVSPDIGLRILRL